MRLIAGLETLTNGEIEIAGREVMDLPPSERGIAMVFQSYALYPHMSVFHNMAFSLELQGLSKAEITKRVEAAAESLQMSHLLDRRPRPFRADSANASPSAAHRAQSRRLFV